VGWKIQLCISNHPKKFFLGCRYLIITKKAPQIRRPYPKIETLLEHQNLRNSFYWIYFRTIKQSFFYNF